MYTEQLTFSDNVVVYDNQKVKYRNLFMRLGQVAGKLDDVVDLVDHMFTLIECDGDELPADVEYLMSLWSDFICEYDNTLRSHNGREIVSTFDWEREEAEREVL